MESKRVHNGVGQTGLNLTTAEVGAIKSHLSQRRRQVILHSYLYYELGREVIADTTWDRWAREVVQLQKQYPDIAEYCDYAVQFRDFDATTGFHFEYDDKIKQDAGRLLKWHDLYYGKTEGGIVE